MFKKKILVIDDTTLMVKLITDVLEAQNYEIISALDGYEGLLKVAEEKPDLIILDVVMPGLDGFEVCRILREDESNNLVPIIMLTSKDKADDKLTGLELGADDYIIKPFNTRELVSRVNNTLRRIDRNRLANPLTGLHGNLEIQAEITSRIARNKVFSVIYADMDNFKAYNDVYGFSRGDLAIKLTADIITDNVRLYGLSREFIGHIGGDDFIIITVPDCDEAICKGIVSDFDYKIPALYKRNDMDNGYIETVDRRGHIVKYPIMSISLAIVSNERRKFENHLELAEVAAELKEKVKTITGSAYIKDRRKC